MKQAVSNLQVLNSQCFNCSFVNCLQIAQCSMLRIPNLPPLQNYPETIVFYSLRGRDRFDEGVVGVFLGSENQSSRRTSEENHGGNIFEKS